MTIENLKMYLIEFISIQLGHMENKTKYGSNEVATINQMDQHGLCSNSQHQGEILHGSRGVIFNMIKSQKHIHLHLLRQR